MSRILDIANKLLKSSGGSSDGEPLPPIERANDQTPDETKLVEHIKSKIDLVRQTNSRIAIEGIYLTNVAYLMGFDGVYYDTTYRQFKNIDPKRKLSRNRFKVNKILPSVQNRLSRLTQSPPRFDVRPNSNSTEDKDSARLGLQVIEDVFDKQGFDEKRQDIHMSAMQGGVSYAQSIWDPTLGKPMLDPETNEFSGYEGDVRIEVLNCLEVFPDPLAKNLEDCQWIIKAKIRKLDYFKDRYPGRGEAVKEEGAWLLSSLYDLKSNALTSVGIVGAQTHDQQKNSAIELVYYEKRSKDYSNGRMIICASGVLLEDKELPIGEYDIVKFDDIKIGGRYNSEAVITHLRPIQDQYNITRTRMANWIRAHLGGKYIAAKGANLGQEAINNGDTEVVEFTPVPNAAPPSAMSIPQIPPYAYKDLETQSAEFDYISGINEISRGVLPSASIPASGMAFLQEQDQTRIGVQTTSNEIAYAKLGCCILKYVGKYFEMPRLLKTAGEGLEYAVKDFKGSDLNDNYDVIVIPGSTIPQSKVLRRQDILNLLEVGLLGNPQDPKVQSKVLGELETGDIAEVWKSRALKENQFKKVIAAVEAGDQTIMQKLNQFDDQQFHLTEMNDYRISDKFDALDPEKQKLFMNIMEWRLQALVSITNPQIPQQQMLAEQMVKNMPQAFAQHNAMLAQHPGAPGSTMPTPGMDQQGNPTAPPAATQPVPNAAQLPNMQRGA